ncbi:hypothetical protein [Flavobacterium hercynium]|uniref:SH3b domain-containing protein n=1 Tax=Flavobacterium hercynium TaxID=387094 RepID=A0A226H2B5_9FLAO|nr:hypothetical protein [Flavobacterium hercynium]OXA88335.1 hypothetical protein B0A66_15460 [Flavobacterium hercynium]SMP30529.1 hypothetical protein SAMN06265346_11370 [Flavobacterium hercynium]
MYSKNFSSVVLTFTLFLLSFISHAQLAVIYDKDGYVNVRQGETVKSKVIEKIIEGQVFFISLYEDPEPKGEWLKVWLPVNPDPKIKEFLRYKSINEEGFIHKSRILYLNELKKLNLLNQNANKSTLKKDNLQVDVEIKAFDKTKHTISRIKDGGYIIDNKSDFWGFSNSIPRNEFKSIKIIQNNNTYNFPKEALAHLYDLNVEFTSLFLGKNGELYLIVSGGDGSESYEIIWCLKNNRIFSMTVMQTIP